ncbi:MULTISPECIES: MFS transporter [unclassified Streptomyces]|uniref:MFS transporter n=1 Tax=unclassified Streptomyces TaxID=2593676 RepID=UPI003825C9CA
MVKASVRRLVIDVGPLKAEASFRRLWIGGALSSVGSRMTTFAVVLQVYQLTGSSAAVGAVGLATLVPTLVVGLIGGSLADALDRRKLVLVTGSSMAGVSLLFAVQAFAGNAQVWPLYLLVTVQSLLFAVDLPARRTFVPRLLSKEQLPAGLTLQMLVFHMSVMVGPSLGGVLAAAGGVKVCYVIDALSFFVALYGVVRLPAMPAQAQTRPGVKSIYEGLRYVGRNRIVAGAMLSDLSATVLAMPFAILPALNTLDFGGSPSTLGLLTAAPAVGGVLAMSLSGPVGRATRKGVWLLGAGAVWGVALACLGLTGQLWLALGLLAAAGAADATAVVLRGSIVQSSIPEEFRGRTTSVDFVVGAGGPHLGNFRGGVVASAATPSVSALTGGLSCVVAIGLVALCFPALRRFDSAADGPPAPEPGPPERGGSGESLAADDRKTTSGRSADRTGERPEPLGGGAHP